MSRQQSSASVSAIASTSLPTQHSHKLLADRTAPTAIAFTKSSVRDLQCPPGRREAFFWDASCRGFGMRVLRSGRRTWIFQYRDGNGQTRRMALGDVSVVSLAAARDAARWAAVGVATGNNPSLERRKRRAAAKLVELIEGYLQHAKTTQRPRSYKETERHLRIHATPIHHNRAENVQRAEISGLLLKVAQQSGPVAANRLRAALSAFWSWGLRTGLIEGDSNPVAFTIRQPEKARDRVLSDDELRAIWEATADQSDYSRIVRLCLLTGCRREEIGGLRWSEVLDGRIVISADRMKGKLAHEIALLPLISAALPSRGTASAEHVFGRRGTGFSGYAKGKRKLDAALVRSRIQFVPWGLHDLRRTFSTRLHEAGAEPLVIEALLAHKQQGVAAVYNRASFREAKKAALERWHEILHLLIGPNA